MTAQLTVIRTPGEIEEAREAIASNQAAFDKSGIRQSFNPATLPSPYGGKPDGHLPKGGISPLAGLNPPNEKP